jgi:hypothetical protein
VSAALASKGDFDLLRLDGQRQAALGPDFQTDGDRFADVGEGFVAGVTLTDTSGYGRALSDPNALFIALKCGDQLHLLDPIFLYRLWKVARSDPAQAKMKVADWSHSKSEIVP